MTCDLQGAVQPQDPGAGESGQESAGPAEGGEREPGPQPAPDEDVARPRATPRLKARGQGGAQGGWG